MVSLLPLVIKMEPSYANPIIKALRADLGIPTIAKESNFRLKADFKNHAFIYTAGI